MGMDPPSKLVDSIRRLWELPAPVPMNIFSHPDLIKLHECCLELYFADGHAENQRGNLGGLRFALYDALRSLGFPACTTAQQLVLPRKLSPIGLISHFGKMRLNGFIFVHSTVLMMIFQN